MKAMDNAYAARFREVVLDINGTPVTFTAREVGFMAHQHVARRSADPDYNAAAGLLAASVTDPEGNRFTYDEVCRLKREYAEPLLRAVAELHEENSEKN